MEGLRALGLERFQLDVGHAEFLRGLLDEIKGDRARARELQAALSRKDASALARLVGELAPAAHVGEALLALPALVGRDDALARAGRLVRNARSERALENLSEVYRLVRIYGLADSVILDLGEVRGFDYYSGVHFEAYVTGLGASIAGGGRYDQMLGRFGYECPATGFAFDVGRALLAMETQGVTVPLAGPEFFRERRFYVRLIWDDLLLDKKINELIKAIMRHLVECRRVGGRLKWRQVAVAVLLQAQG